MINKAIILGNVGQDPQIKTFENGNKVAQFSVATSETWKDKNGEKQASTEWHNVSVFGKLADIIEQYLKKGQTVYLEGKIKTRSWETKEGEKRYSTDIVLNGFDSVFKMVGKNSSTEYSPAPPQAEGANNQAMSDPAGDLPFAPCL